MRYTINAETFITLPVTSGTIQNISNTDIEISDTQTVGSGIILKAGEYFSFHDATIYACARPVLDGGVGIISVVPFEEGGKGGGSGSDTYALPTASESVKGGIKIGYIIPRKCNILYEECEDDGGGCYYSLGYFEGDEFIPCFTWFDNDKDLYGVEVE